MADTEDTVDPIPPGLAETAGIMQVYVQFGALSHRGNVRKNNEDHFVVMRRTRSREVLLTSLATETLPEAEEEGYVMIVADGMGGAAFGEVASELALRTAWELGSHEVIWPQQINDREVQRLLQDSNDCVQLIHQLLQQRSHECPEMTGMGTTLTAVYSVGADAFVVHVGDSRAYLIRGETIRQITRDHTLAQQLMDAGVDASRTVAFQHVLTNCLGGDADNVSSDVHHLQLQDGDHLLLCTDGLSDLVHEDEIQRIVQESQHPQEACRWLVDLALQRGGKDNVTVLLGRYTLLHRVTPPAATEAPQAEPFPP
jgi:PPM family protein phosphatase